MQQAARQQAGKQAGYVHTWLGSSGLVSMLLQTARCCAYSTRWHSWLQKGVALQPGHQLGRMRSLMGLPQVAHLQAGQRGSAGGRGEGGTSEHVQRAVGGKQQASQCRQKRPSSLGE